MQIEPRKILYALGGILLLTLIVYWKSLGNGFVNLDDDRYIENNQLIRAIDVKLFFTTQQLMGNYHPLVLWVYSIIYHYAQLNPEAYHAVNLIIHLINTALLFFVVLELFSVFEIAVLVSLLFGIHPMHVESVAWVSELKDLMYTGFFLSSLYFYIRYLKNDFRANYFLLSVLFFLLSVLSKGMGVSLTVVLVLIDFYFGRKFTSKVIVEKIPFFILSVIFGIVAVKAQQALGAVQDIALFSFPQRIVFACYGFVTYIGKLILPLNLSAYYPYPAKTNDTIPAFYYLYPFAALAIIALVIHSLRKTKKIFFAVGFYTITVGLVLQLLPVGGAIIADRYSYIPSIGIFLLLGFGFHELIRNTSYRTFTIPVAAIIILIYSYLTFQQTKIWNNGMTLWSNVINNGNEVSLAYNNRGVLYKKLAESGYKQNPQQAETDLQKAMTDYQHSLTLDPNNADTWSNIGLIYWEQANHNANLKAELFPKALTNMNKALEINPQFATAYSNRGSIYSTMNNQEAALKDYAKATELDPNFADAWYNLGIVNYNLGRKDNACTALRRAAALGHPVAPNAVHDLCK